MCASVVRLPQVAAGLEEEDVAVSWVGGKLEGLPDDARVRDSPGLSIVVGALHSDAFGRCEVGARRSRDRNECVDSRLVEAVAGIAEVRSSVEGGVHAECGHIDGVGVRWIREEAGHEAAPEPARWRFRGDPGRASVCRTIGVGTRDRDQRRRRRRERYRERKRRGSDGGRLDLVPGNAAALRPVEASAFHLGVQNLVVGRIGGESADRWWSNRRESGAAVAPGGAAITRELDLARLRSDVHRRRRGS